MATIKTATMTVYTKHGKATLAKCTATGKFCKLALAQVELENLWFPVAPVALVDQTSARVSLIIAMFATILLALTSLLDVSAGSFPVAIGAGGAAMFYVFAVVVELLAMVERK